MKKASKKVWLLILSVVLVICIMGGVTFAMDALNKSAVIQWNGNSCFTITTKNKTKIVIDPLPESIGYKVPELTADIVTVSHDHYDHNNVTAVKGKFKEIRERGEFNDKNIKINGIKTYHDTAGGISRGENTVYTYNIDGVNVCHLGDLGHELTAEQIKNIGKVDIVMIPVGGLYTIDAEVAAKVVEQLNPKVVMPMHYKTDALSDGFGMISKVDSFLEIMKDWKVVKADTYTFNKSDLSKSKDKKIVILSYSK